MDRDDLRAGIGPEFVRLYHGRQWHVARPVLDFAGAEEALIGAAWCGESWPERGSKQPERLTAAVPRGAMVCTRCVSEVNSYRSVVLGVALADRRRAMADLWPTLLDGYDDVVVDAEIHCGDCEHVEHIGPCTLVEGNRITKPCDCYVTGEWPCGSCGHPNLDHDCDDGTCTVTNDDPGVSWAECPCRGLRRAG